VKTKDKKNDRDDDDNDDDDDDDDDGPCFSSCVWMYLKYARMG